MYVISVNYKNTTADERERFSFGTETVLELLETLSENDISESVYLNTCNRVELYVSDKIDKAIEIFGDFSDSSYDECMTYMSVKGDEEAVLHLYNVSAGLESMVLGEDEILGQMKSAYALSRENGYTGYFFNCVFQSAFAAAKRIKTDTMLSKSSVSVATIAALKCHKFAVDGAGKKVLVIGASGDIGRKVVKNLLSYGDCEIVATKSHRSVEESGVKVVDYHNRLEYVGWADIIVSCTRSTHLTINIDHLNLSQLPEKPRLFVDLAVPRDIDKRVLDIEGNTLITIDEIEELAKDNNALKQVEAKKAELIIGECMEDFYKALYTHDCLDNLRDVSARFAGDFKKFVVEYRNLATADEFMSFLNIIKQMEE